MTKTELQEAGPLVIQGRTRYADKATTKVTIQRYQHEPAVLEIYGGLIEERGHNGEFHLGAKHESATDVEHDASYVAYLEGAGLRYHTMLTNGMVFTGVILQAKFYPTEPVPEDVEMCEYGGCKREHGTLPFTPPSQRWEPANYWITVQFGV